MSVLRQEPHSESPLSVEVWTTLPVPEHLKLTMPLCHVAVTMHSKKVFNIVFLVKKKFNNQAVARATFQLLSSGLVQKQSPCWNPHVLTAV